MSKENNQSQSGVTIPSLLIACLFSTTIGIAGSHFLAKLTTAEIVQPKIFSLDAQAVLNAQIAALLNDKVTDQVRVEENQRFPVQLKNLLNRHAQEGHIIIHKDAMIGPDPSLDLTKSFINTLVYRP